MNIELRILQERDTNAIKIAYYKFYEKMYGSTLFGKFTLRSLIAGEKISSFLSITDTNYYLTEQTILETNENFNCIMLGVYNESGQMIALTRLKLNKNDVLVGEIILLDDGLPVHSQIDLYSLIIEKIEKVVKESVETAEVLTFEIPINNAPYIVVAQERGYSLALGEEEQYPTRLYDKYIKDNNLKRCIELDKVE